MDEELLHRGGKFGEQSHDNHDCIHFDDDVHMSHIKMAGRYLPLFFSNNDVSSESAVCESMNEKMTFTGQNGGNLVKEHECNDQQRESPKKDWAPFISSTKSHEPYRGPYLVILVHGFQGTAAIFPSIS